MSLFINRHSAEVFTSLDDELYSKDYNLIIKLRNKDAYKICHISIDKHGVDRNKMHDICKTLSPEHKRMRLYNRVRKKSNYIHYPFYQHKV
jgi:hypothetical protein